MGVLGPTLWDLKQSDMCDLLPLDTARQATAQLASALAQIHSSHMIYGGDSYSFISPSTRRPLTQA